MEDSCLGGIFMSVIENGLRADIMRKRMEDKNALQNKGSLYVGTGNKETIENKDIYKYVDIFYIYS